MHFRLILLLIVLNLTAISHLFAVSYPLDCSCENTSDTIFVRNTLDDGLGSLRCAINCANEQNDYNHIRFDLINEQDSIIILDSPLPFLRGNLSIVADSIRIHLDGSALNIESIHGLRIEGDSVLISGLTLEYFPNNAIDNYQGYKQISIHNNELRNNGRLSSSGDGIDFRMASQCTISHNIIEGNFKDGIYLQSCSDLSIYGNEITGNYGSGIYVYQSDHVSIGDSCVDCSNLISGNFKNGIHILENSGNIDILNNIIGLSIGLDLAFPNRMNGLSVSKSDSIQIGQTFGSNYISGNYFSGIEIVDSSSYVDIINNHIGFSGLNNVGIPNGLNGIRIMNSSIITVGGSNNGESNRIGYQPNSVYIGDQSSYCSIRNNHFECSVNGINIEPNCNDNIQAIDDFIIEDAYTISGMDDAYIDIQVYRKNDHCVTCQGNEFIGSGFTYTGFWEIKLDQPLQNGDQISILKTDLNGNTAMFSTCIEFNCDSFNVDILNNQDDRLCEGENLILTTSGGEEFFWSTGETSSEIRIYEGGEYAVTVLNDMGCPSIDTVFIETFPSPELSLIPQDSFSFCEDYTIIKAEGEGIFQWNNGIYGPSLEVQETGTYCVTLTNIYGCSVSACLPVTKGASANAEIELIGDANFCHGESAQLVAKGGESFFWSTGEYNQDTITIFQSGTYQVTVVNEFGCEDSAEIEITVFPSVSASIAPSGPINLCYGESITLTASGGVNYFWNDGTNADQIQVDELGIYFVTVENEYGCSEVISQVVSVNPPIQGGIIPGGPTSFCEGDSVWLFAEGINLDSVIWKDSPTPDSLLASNSGWYEVDMYSFGCALSDSIEIIEWPLPEIDSIIGQNWSFPDSIQQFEILNADSTSSYIWEVEGGSIIVDDSTNIIQVLWENNDLGKICVYPIDKNHCIGSTNCKMIDLSTLFVMELNNDLIRLYPNPSSAMLNLSFDPERKWDHVSMEFYNPLGSILHKEEFIMDKGVNKKQLDMRHLPEGVYWIKIYTDKKLSSIQKWMLHN